MLPVLGIRTEQECPAYIDTFRFDCLQIVSGYFYGN